jgi:excisionase family DNA binding protein
MAENNELLRIEDFAAALRVKPACIRRWILERRITSVKVGRLVRIPSSEVGRIVEKGLRPYQHQGGIGCDREGVPANA